MAPRLEYVDPNRPRSLFSRAYAALTAVPRTSVPWAPGSWTPLPHGVSRCSRNRVGAGLLSPTALDSTELEHYGQPGPGRWITIYANSAHAWIAVAGIALDTADYGGPAVPAGTGPRWRSEPLANLSYGTSYVARHPPGL